MSLTGRMGVFFTLIGIFMVILYIASDAARQGQCGLLGWGVVITAVGISLWSKGRKPPEPNQRFKTFKRLTTSDKKKDKGKKPR
jgi:hypothetical protein